MPLARSRLLFISPEPAQPHLPLFVYLPGMDGTGKLMAKQAARLVHYFDVRCLSIPAEDMSDWNGLARQVIELIKGELVQKTNNCVYLCGESFGGCLALKIVLSAKSLIQKLILVNPASSFSQQPLLSWGIELVRSVPSSIHQAGAVGLLPFLADLSRIAPDDRRALLQAMKSVPQKIVSWRLSLLKNFVASDRDLQSLSQPSLILAGTGDRLLPSVEEAKRLVNCLPDGRLIILPDSGHACLLEKQVNLYRIIKEQNFLP